MIAQILGLNDDQMTSQYQVKFPAGIPGGAGAGGDIIALRMDQAVDVPAEVVGEYEYFYKGMKIVKTNQVDETDKHISLQVRLDQQWDVFEALKTWKRMVHEPNLGTKFAWALINTTILIEALDGLNQVTKTVRIGGAVIKSLKITSFEPNGADPSRLELEFVFSTIDYE